MKQPNALKLSSFDYQLPKALIAHHPIQPRDHVQLLVFNRDTHRTEHKRFDDIGDYFNSGDVLVLNNSKVIPARLHGTKDTGGKIEIFLLTKIKKNNWETLIRGSIKPGQVITISKDIKASIVNPRPTSGLWQVQFNVSDAKLFKAGETPLPPYITSTAPMVDYQTVYAKTQGSVAAPTAGLHFTKRLLNKLQKRGVIVTYITLHVGLGTFQSVKTDDIRKHIMHSELATISPATARTINAAHRRNNKVIACGTTTIRTLETFASTKGELLPGKKWTNIFIYPGYDFKVVDGIITNFHLPKSSLIMLVSAFIGQQKTMHLYKLAIKYKYRFYSFGDAMLLL